MINSVASIVMPESRIEIVPLHQKMPQELRSELGTPRLEMTFDE